MNYLVTSATGQDVVIYIPSKTYDVLQRITEFENLIKALKQAHVPSVVFVSFYADQENNPVHHVAILRLRPTQARSH